jgi:hypothetical protein
MGGQTHSHTSRKRCRIVGHCKFQHALASCSLRLTHITCTTTNQNLEWEDFADFFHLIDITWGTQKTCYWSILDLINFLYSWSNLGRTRGHFLWAQVYKPHLLDGKGCYCCCLDSKHTKTWTIYMIATTQVQGGKTHSKLTHTILKWST